MIEYVIGCAAGAIGMALIHKIFQDEGREEAEGLRQELSRKEMVIRQLIARDGLGSFKQPVWSDSINMKNGDFEQKENK